MQLWALGGDSDTAPSHSAPALWAALAAGAYGLALRVQRTSDDVLFCVAGTSVSGQQSSDLAAMDAGEPFEVRDAGYDDADAARVHPWKGGPKRAPLRYQTLRGVLRTFGRREPVLLFPLAGDLETARQSAAIVEELGLSATVGIVVSAQSYPSLRASYPNASLFVSLSAGGDAQLFTNNGARVPRGAVIQADAVTDASVQHLLSELEAKQVSVLLVHDSGAPPSRAWLEEYRTKVTGLVTPSASRVLPLLQPSFLVMSALEGASPGRGLEAGYSHISNEALVEYSPTGLSITTTQGTAYAGGGAVFRECVSGRFDAQVDFSVDAPALGTTFEIAAIAIDPRLTRGGVQAPTRENVSLVFDVHGAPPYASAERDEDNGFRIGWNNSSNLTRIEQNWSSSSATMYNRYGRDVGSGAAAYSSGSLRLLRRGQVFAAFYADTERRRWICSGAAIVSTLPEDVFIRVAAKHWPKDGAPAPANRIVFSNLKLRQYASVWNLQADDAS
jgi:hypothetical protein